MSICSWDISWTVINGKHSFTGGHSQFILSGKTMQSGASSCDSIDKNDSYYNTEKGGHNELLKMNLRKIVSAKINLLFEGQPI